jgi:hypothetical protein
MRRVILKSMLRQITLVVSGQFATKEIRVTTDAAALNTLTKVETMVVTQVSEDVPRSWGIL